MPSLPTNMGFRRDAIFRVRRENSYFLGNTLWFLLIVILFAIPTSAQETDWWNETVFYEIFVRSFYDSDGDGIGDIQGIIEKLDYLNDGDPTTSDDLGVTGIWLMPVTQSISYHGYDVTDYRQIEADYGTVEDFQLLMAAAHERGIRVIVDFVVNHTSSEHPWFLASAAGDDYQDWYVWADEDPGVRGPGQSQVWHPLGDRYYYGFFWGGMPDLNFNTPAVTDELYDIARYWLEDLGADGFRIDAAKYLYEEGVALENLPQTFTWFADFHDYVASVDPGALILGEVWSAPETIAAYLDEELDLAFTFDLAESIVTSVNSGFHFDYLEQLNTAQTIYPPNQYATFITNHDQNRAMTRFGGNLDRAKLGASLLLTGPGVPFLYYGEEIGMTGAKPDPRIRTPMQWEPGATAGFTAAAAPWQPLAEEMPANTVAAQTDEPDSLLSHYRALIHLRNAHPALQYGEALVVEGPSRLVSLVRHHAGETLLVLVNLGRRPIEDYELALPTGLVGIEPTAEVVFGTGEAVAPEINTGGGFAGYAPLSIIPPLSTTVIRIGD